MADYPVLPVCGQAVRLIAYEAGTPSASDARADGGGLRLALMGARQRG